MRVTVHCGRTQNYFSGFFQSQFLFFSFDKKKWSSTRLIFLNRKRKYISNLPPRSMKSKQKLARPDKKVWNQNLLMSKFNLILWWETVNRFNFLMLLTERYTNVFHSHLVLLFLKFWIKNHVKYTKKTVQLTRVKTFLEGTH